MTELFAFSDMALLKAKNQLAGDSFGPQTSDLFNLSSVFSMAEGELIPVYSILKGRILLQQTSAGEFVNLILKPDPSPRIKLPIRYIIYRGLKTRDFLSDTNILSPSTMVLTAGTELMINLKAIQLTRSSDPIDIKALFGYDLTPGPTKRLDDFFFKDDSPSSQLFTINAGILMGHFYGGPAGSGNSLSGIEIILENPEYFPDVKMAKVDFNQINTALLPTGVSALEIKWNREQARHYIDPSAFYGLHYDIDGGIDCRSDSNPTIHVTTALDTYNNIQSAFQTKNTVYLDIRNENGYSYNYYGNYDALSTPPDPNDSKELQIGITESTLLVKEYYSQGWPVHIADLGTPGTSGSENSFCIKLRTGDNQKPIIALHPTSKAYTGTFNFKSGDKIIFADEKELLPTTATGWTKALVFQVANIPGSTGTQPGTFLRIDYYKQLPANDSSTYFPVKNAADYLFGPVNTILPWRSTAPIQWIESAHYKYLDRSGNGIIRGFLNFPVLSTDFGNRKIILTGLIGDPSVYNKFTVIVSPAVSFTFTINSISEDVATHETTIETKENISQFIIAGNTANIGLDYKIQIDYNTQTVFIPSINLTGNAAFAVNKSVQFNTGLDTNNVNTSFTIQSVNFLSGDTIIRFNQTINKSGTGFIMESGIISEKNASSGTTATENIIFYSVPRFLSESPGSVNTSLFTYEGGTASIKSFFDVIKTSNNKFNITKDTLTINTSIIKDVISYTPRIKIKENLLLLAITKSEWQNLLAQILTPIAGHTFSTFHTVLFKLLPQGGVLKDLSYNSYFHYKLILTGLDTNGAYIETLLASAIDIYSKDGLLFSSNDYATNISVTKALYQLNFRRTNDYSDLSKNQNHFGFDWMRPEYISETDPVAGRGGICVSYNSTTINKSDGQAHLKLEYTPFTISDSPYYVPWLTMYKDHASIIADGHPIKPFHEVILKLEIAKTFSTPTSFSATEKISFEIPDGIEINFLPPRGVSINGNTINAADAAKIPIVIKCTQASDKDRRIIAYDQNDNVVGCLNILKNDKSLKLPFRLVKVNFKGVLTVLDNAGTGTSTLITNFNSNSYSIQFSTPIAPNASGSIALTTQPWINEIQNNKVKISNYFNQNLSQFTLASTREITINFGNYTVGTAVSGTTAVDNIKNAMLYMTPLASPASSRLQIGYQILLTNVAKIYQDAGFAMNTEITVFIMPVTVVQPNHEDDLEAFSPAPSMFSNLRVMLMCGTPGSQESSKLFAHESSHSLNLVHSFIDSGEAGLFNFNKFQTENVMDYIDFPVPPGGQIDPKVSYWKWQLVQAFNENPDLII